MIQESDTDMVSDTGESEMETDHVSSSHAHARHVPRSLSAPTFQPIRSTEGTDSEVDTSKIFIKGVYVRLKLKLWHNY